MHAIEVTTDVGDDRKVTLTLPEGVTPGKHRLIVVVAAPEPSHDGRREPFSLPILSVPGWPADYEVSRDDVYDDDGR